jgi:tetratricopeptide (TPR) repeat protein
MLIVMIRFGLLFLLILLLATAAIAQSRGFRSITIVSEPNAAVWVDGVRYGTTGADGGLTITTISPGKHAIRVRAGGFAEASKPLPPTHRGDFPVKLTATSDEAWLAFQEGERYASTDRTKTIEAYRRAIKLNPKLIAAHLGLSRALSEGGNTEAALAAIKALRTVSPRNAEASAIEGRIYKDLDNEPKAIAAFKRAIAEGGGFQPEAYAGLGLLYKEKAEAGDPEAPEVVTATKEAVKNLSIAVKQLSGAPDAMVIMQLLGTMYERQKRFKEAIAVYEDFLRIFPDSNEAEAVKSFIVQINKQLAEQ